MKKALAGKMIFVPQTNDMIEILKIGLKWKTEDFEQAEVEFVDLDADLDAACLKIFDTYPEALVYSGQNLRGLALQYSDKFVEVLNEASIPPKGLAELSAFAENCLVFNASFANELGLHIDNIQIEKNLALFKRSLSNFKFAEKVIHEIASEVTLNGAKPSQKFSAVEHIIEKTYQVDIL